jgi:hypothetical protein
MNFLTDKLARILFIPFAIAASALMAEPYDKTYPDTITCNCAAFGPFCLMAVKNGSDCTVTYASTQEELDRLRPVAETENAYQACRGPGKPGGYMISGVCRTDVSAGPVEAHFTRIAQERAKAIADCGSRGATVTAPTEIWFGIYEYTCSDGQGGNAEPFYDCHKGECVDDGLWGGAGCRKSNDACPGGAIKCGDRAECP